MPTFIYFVIESNIGLLWIESNFEFYHWKKKEKKERKRRVSMWERRTLENVKRVQFHLEEMRHDSRIIRRMNNTTVLGKWITVATKGENSSVNTNGILCQVTCPTFPPWCNWTGERGWKRSLDYQHAHVRPVLFSAYWNGQRFCVQLPSHVSSTSARI